MPLKGCRRMSAIPIANGGLLHRALDLPDFRNSAVAVKKLGATPRGERPHPRQLPPGSHAAEHVQLSRLRAGRDAVQTGWRRSTKPAGKSGLLLLAKVNCLTNSPASNWSKSGFNCAPAGCICLEPVTQPEAAQAALIHQLNWPLPQQPPPRIYKADFQECVDNLRATFLARSRGKPSAPIKKMRKSG